MGKGRSNQVIQRAGPENVPVEQAGRHGRDDGGRRGRDAVAEDGKHRLRGRVQPGMIFDIVDWLKELIKVMGNQVEGIGAAVCREGFKCWYEPVLYRGLAAWHSTGGV